MLIIYQGNIMIKKKSMRSILYIFLLFLLFLAGGCAGIANTADKEVTQSKEKPPLIPQPVSVEWTQGEFSFNDDTSIYTVPEFEGIAVMMAEKFQRINNAPLSINTFSTPRVSNAIIVIQDYQMQDYGKEAYQLTVTPERIFIRAAEKKGAFYAFQTLRQMLPHDIERQDPVNISWEIPGVQILDYPRFTWRGYMLDSARHFQTIDEIKRIIDLLALHKINRFHWHLIDDQGWRMDIPQYPKLTEISAFRPNANAFLNYIPSDSADNYGGYYTHEEIHELVKYASQRNITIIPEIEMPGHTLSSLMAYPELSCRGKEPGELGETWIYKDVYCAGNEDTFTFLEDVLDIVFELFPSPWIHVGGDEVPKDRWQECPKCQSRIEEEGLRDEEELQSYFMRRMEEYLSKNGRQLIGWDDIMEGGLSDSAIVQTYREPEFGINAANMGNQVIFSTHLFVYFDYNHEGTPITKTYSFEPVTEDIHPDKVDNILGIEACQWLGNVSRRYLENTGEIMPAQRIEYQTFPRLLAMSEVAWSPREARNWNNFQCRLRRYRTRLDRLGVNYYPVQQME